MSPAISGSGPASRHSNRRIHGRAACCATAPAAGAGEAPMTPKSGLGTTPPPSSDVPVAAALPLLLSADDSRSIAASADTSAAAASSAGDAAGVSARAIRSAAVSSTSACKYREKTGDSARSKSMRFSAACCSRSRGRQRRNMRRRSACVAGSSSASASSSSMATADAAPPKVRRSANTSCRMEASTRHARSLRPTLGDRSATHHALNSDMAVRYRSGTPRRLGSSAASMASPVSHTSSSMFGCVSASASLHSPASVRSMRPTGTPSFHGSLSVPRQATMP
mmetsp:Transcript_16780/g.58653  ORF Transcript_16780/g.58653 Transcript_16780/m.58653 type:complete len:281 (+) Transcript_16780:5331-6173(+)